MTGSRGLASVSENVFGHPGEWRVIATIRELAEQLGVSVATVSRVLNDYPDVAPDTRERVLAAIREHDFTPVRAARSLVTGRTH